MRHWRKKPWVDSDVRNWDYVADHLLPEASSEESGKTLIVGEDGVWELGDVSGGGIDFSDIKQSYDLNNIGGLFTAFEDGTWDSFEFNCVSGTNPIVIDFGRPFSGCVCYPKNRKIKDDLVGEQIAFYITFLNPPDENGLQTKVLDVSENSSTATQGFPRVTAISRINGVFTITPAYPTNANYHPFGFNVPYVFVYWWEDDES